MQLSEDVNEGNEIRSYESGKINVNGEVYETNLVLTSAKVITDWDISNLSDLDEETLAKIEALSVDVIIFGTGARQILLPEKIMYYFLKKNIGVEVMATDAACRTYTVLVAEERKVAAVLIL